MTALWLMRHSIHEDRRKARSLSVSLVDVLSAFCVPRAVLGAFMLDPNCKLMEEVRCIPWFSICR